MGTLEVEQIKRVCIDLLRRNPGASVSVSSMKLMNVIFIKKMEEEGAQQKMLMRKNKIQSLHQAKIPHQEDLNTPPPPGVDVLIVARCQQISGKNAKPRGNQRCISLTGEFARLCLDNYGTRKCYAGSWRYGGWWSRPQQCCIPSSSI